MLDLIVVALRRLALVLFLSLMPKAGFAQSAPASTVPIQFAILLEDSDPIHGEAVCVLGKTCVLVDREDSTLRVSIKMSGREDRASEIKIFCSTFCSFKNRHSTMAFSSESQFTFFEGEEMGEVPLVLKARKKLGEVLLIIPELPQKVDHPQL